MNVENVQKLILLLKSIPEKSFNMDAYFKSGGKSLSFIEFVEHYPRDCGTAACIAGWANVLMESGTYRDSYDKANTPDVSYDSNVSARWMGLSSFHANQLFFAGRHSLWERYHREIDLDVDTTAIENGVGIVDWSKIRARHAVRLLEMLLNEEAYFLDDLT